MAEEPGLQSSADAVIIATQPNHNTANRDSPRPRAGANRMSSFRSFFGKEQIALQSAQMSHPQPVPARSGSHAAIAASGSSVDVQYPAHPWNSSTAGRDDAQEKTPLASEVSARLGESWQPVCQMGIDVVNWLNLYSSRRAERIKSLGLTHHRNATGSTGSSKLGLPAGGLSATKDASTPVADAPNTWSGQPSETSVTTVEDSTDAALGRNSHQMRGSIMAVVVGLVVGIMWF